MLGFLRSLSILVLTAGCSLATLLAAGLFRGSAPERVMGWWGRAFMRLEKLFLKMFQVEPRTPIRLAMLEEMERDTRVFVIGEDVGRYGGTYAVTKGLQAAAATCSQLPAAVAAVIDAGTRGDNNALVVAISRARVGSSLKY